MAKLAYPPNTITSYLNKTRYKGRVGSNHPKFIVLHATAGRQAGDLKVLRGQTSRKVSVHFYITKHGLIHYLVGRTRAAWHAGVSLYHGVEGLNDESIGIELENLNTGHDPYTEAQLDALDNILEWLDVTLGHELPIVTHAQIAMPRGRKTDPVRFVEMADYLKFRDHDPETPDEYHGSKPRKPKAKVYKVVTDRLNLRSGPSQTKRVVAVLKRGNRVTQTAPRLGKWIPVKRLGKRGYVHSDYVKKA